MLLPSKRYTTHLNRQVWFAAVLGVVLVLLFASVALAETHKQEPLPPCLDQTTLFFSASPFYEQDHALFLSTVHPGTIWRSDDAGFTWSNLVDMSRYDGFVFRPVTVVPAGLNPGFPIYNDWTVLSNFSITARLLWYSDNSGVTWQVRTPSPGEARNNMYPTDDVNIMFALENYSPQWASWGIWRTDNGAQWWTQVWDGTEALDLAVSPNYSQDQTVFASLEDVSPELGSPVIVSTDGGETWQGRGGDDLCNAAASSLQLSPNFPQDRTLFVQQAGSFFRSRDGGETWQVVFPPDRPHCDGGVVAPEVRNYLLSPNYAQDHTIFMVARGVESSIKSLYITDDDGANWTPLFTNRSLELLMVLPAIAGQSSLQQPVARATPMSSGPPSVGPWAIKANSDWTVFLPLVDWSAAQPTARPFTLFINAWNGVDGWAYYRSDNGGLSWACMQLPTVQPPARTQYLGRGG